MPGFRRFLPGRPVVEQTLVQTKRQTAMNICTGRHRQSYAEAMSVPGSQKRTVRTVAVLRVVCPFMGVVLLLATALLPGPHSALSAPAETGDVTLLDLTALPPSLDYAAWMAREGWSDERPFSDSSGRFRLEAGSLRLESRGDSFLIARTLDLAQQRSLETHPYLRMVVRVDRVPEGANLIGEAQDDSALRVYAGFRDRPPRSIVYAWTWTLPQGNWSARGRSFWGDFREVRRKSIGQGMPPAGRWLTVEMDLRADYRQEFPEGPLPVLRGLALKADSNNTTGGNSLAWVRKVSLHHGSLKTLGLRDGASYGDTELRFR